MALVRLQGKQEKEQGIYYEVDSSGKPIGEGGMGKVFKGKAVNTKTGVKRDVAIKFMFMNLSDQVIERARREASIRLRNDNLVEMLGFIETEEERDGKVVKHYHVVSELLNGVSLADIIKGKCTGPDGKEIPYARELLNDFQKQPEHFAKVVIKAVLSGIMALHDAGYIHRDIDPSNIFITDDGHIKIIDFGISKQVKQLTTNDQALTVAGVFMGKPEYASPELALGDLKYQNQTTDIYAIGVLLYQCITGNVPFEGTRFDVLDKQMKEKLPIANVKSKELRRIIDKATAKRQDLRYQTAAEMRVDLENLDVKRAMDPRKRRMIIIGSSVAIVLVVGSLIGFHSYRQNKERKLAELEQKNYTDSLMSVVNTGIQLGDSLMALGAKHDEGFDSELAKAKSHYRAAASAATELKGRNVKTPDFSAKEKKLDALISQAVTELNDKAEILGEDPDPVVVEEANSIRKRAESLQSLLKPTPK